MSEHRSSPARASNPRRERAEAAAGVAATDLARMSPEQVQRLVHELKVQQIELQMQNEELRMAQSEQTQQVRMMGAAVSYLAEGIVITGDGLERPGPRIIFVNRAMCRITGYSAEELIGETPRMLQGPATHREVLAHLRAELSAGRSCQIQLVNYRKDGTPYPAEMFITPMFDGGGKYTHYVGICRDLTDRKATEDDLTTLGRIIEESLNEIYIFDPATFKFVQVNRGGRENLGYTMDELRELTPLDLKPSLDLPGFQALIGPLLSGEVDKIDFETRHRRKDGSYYDAEVAMQMADYRGIRCCVGIVLDTTRRKELEQEVVKASEEERQRIAHDLHDDLGSQLTGLKLHIESAASALAARKRKPEECFGPILQQVREAITRTREIAQGLRPVGSEPEDLMGALSGMTGRTEAASGIRCRFECPEPVFVVDPHVANHLFRIAQEAVNNALKHSGATSITVSLKNTGQELELRINDNGKGFQRYAGNGGLGLHIMEYRAHAVKGHLRVRSSDGGGTRLACHVPKAAPAR